MGRIPEKNSFFFKAVGFMLLHELKIVLEISVRKNCFDIT